MRIVRADDEGAGAPPRSSCARGGVVVVPTDTVYGLAARPADADAVQAVFRVKGRPEGMHLPVLAASVAQVRALGVAFTPGADALGPALVAGAPDPGLRLRRRARPAGLAGRARRGGGAHPGPRLPAGPAGADRRRCSSPAPTPTARPRRARPGTWRPASVPAVDLVVDGGPLDDVPRRWSTCAGPSRWSSARARSRGPPSPAPWRRPGEPALLAIETSCDETAAAVVDDTLVGALLGGGQPDRPARRLRWGRPRVGQPRPPRDDHPDRRAGPGRGRYRRGGPDRGGGHLGTGPGRRAPGRHRHGQGAGPRLGRPRGGRQPPGGPPGQRVPDRPEVPFPQIALLVSGGHCMLTRSTEPGRYELLGETVDDSIGEAYDKVARFLGLGYPGGPVLDRLAASGDDVLGFPRPMLAEGYTFSFSGLKTAVVNHVRADPGLLGDRGGGLVRGRLHGRAHRQAPPGPPRSSATPPSPSSAAWPPVPFCGPAPRRWPTSSAPGC